jgi:cellulose synthase/poly-beta-1,6-N-acetylglucosamine synthase-like glycosyltransferase
MTLLLFIFLGAAVLLWLSVFGYLLVLAALALPRRVPRAPLIEAPDIAVVVPTLNEERLILTKLRDLRRSEYPRERMTVVVVDGGSTDRTAALVAEEIARGEPIRLLRMEGARGKTEQINHALRQVAHDIVVATDVDAVLDPACIGELVTQLQHDRETAVVGATVRPATRLLEERIHWWFLNQLWWLEGEVLSAALVSGVCYAVRREIALELPADAPCEDAHLALRAASRGHRVRLCRTAVATEVRVPQTARELVRFRRRRGTGYVRELLRVTPPPGAPAGWRLARALRIWHFLVTPAVGAIAAGAAVVLLCSPHWPWPLLTAGVFAAPLLAGLLLSSTLAGCARPWRLGVAAGSLLTLTWWSMVALGRATFPPEAEGG